MIARLVEEAHVLGPLLELLDPVHQAVVRLLELDRARLDPLLQLVARPAQRFLRLPALGDVAQERRVEGLAFALDRRHRDLDRELGAVRAHGQPLDALPPRARLAAQQAAAQGRLRAAAQTRRHDEIVDEPAHRLLAGVPEGLLGGGIELHDAAGRVHRDHAVERAFQDGALARLALAQILRRAVHLLLALLQRLRHLVELFRELPQRARLAGHARADGQVPGGQARGGGQQRLHAAHDEQVARRPGREHAEQASDADGGEHAHETAVGLRVGLARRDADGHVQLGVVGAGGQGCEGEEALHSVRSDAFGRALLPCAQDRLHDFRAGDLAQTAPGRGLPREQRALAVHQEEDRARRDLGRLRELLEPGEVEQRVDHAAHGIALAEDGISEGERGPRRDPARLDGTDRERARGHDLAEEGPRMRFLRAEGGKAAADALAPRAQEADVRVDRMLMDEAVEEQVAGRPGASSNLGKLGERGQEVAGQLDQPLVVGGGQPREQKGVVPDPLTGRPAFLDPRVHREAKGREDGHEDQEDEPRAETKEGKARHHALSRL